MSALPASAQAKKDALAEAESNPQAVVEPTAVVTQTPTPQTNVTVSREEFNDLQAASDRLKAAEGRSETLALDLEVLQRRLTELESASKDKPTANSTPAPTVSIPTVAYTDQEQQDYGDSRDYIRKVCAELLSEVLPGALKQIEDKVEAVQTVAKQATSSVQSVAEKSERQRQKEFNGSVKAEVPEFDAIVNNKHWPAFVQSMEDVSGLTYAECIQNNLARENLIGMVNVFAAFKKKYGVGNKPDTSGYAGATPSGNTDVPSGDGDGKEILKFSARKELNKKFMNQKISYEDYQTEKAKFDLAEKEGRLNYDA